MRKILLIAVMAFCPIILRFHGVEWPMDITLNTKQTLLNPDVYCWAKMMFLAEVVAILLLWPCKTRGGVRTYLFLTICSALGSRYQSIVYFGFPNYLEGALSLGCYVVLYETARAVTMTADNFKNPLRFVTWAVFSTCVVQYFSTPLFVNLVTPLIGAGDVKFGMEPWPIAGALMNSNVLGTFAALCYGYFLARRDWLHTALCVLMGVASQSRGGWVAMAVATLYVCCKYRRAWVLVPVAFFAMSVPVVLHHGNAFKTCVNSSGRVYVWRTGLKRLSWRHLIYGSGPGTFAMEFPQWDAKGKIAQGWTPETLVDRPHSFYLQVLHDSGALALLALLSVFAGFILNSKEIALNAAVLSYLVNVFFTDSSTTVAPLFWIILGTGVGRIKKQERA